LYKVEQSGPGVGKVNSPEPPRAVLLRRQDHPAHRRLRAWAAVSTPTPGSSRGTWAGTFQEARRWSWRIWPARPRPPPRISGNAARARSRRQAEGHSLPV